MLRDGRKNKKRRKRWGGVPRHIKNALEMHSIQRGCVTFYMDESQTPAEFDR
jgi:hypothetical protein